MKKVLAAFSIVLMAVSFTYAADSKVSALTELAVAPAESDELYINDGGVSKKITVLNLLKVLEAARTGFEIHADNLPATDAELAALAALTFADASVIQLTGASAAAVLTSGGNNYILGSNSDNSALEFKTPANVLSQIGAQAAALYDANTVLYATTDNTPAALTVGEQTVVGRVTSGAIAALAIDSDIAAVSAAHDTLPSAKAVKNRIQYKSWSFDPKAVCDGAVDRLFLMSSHGGQGVIVTKWAISFEADPTTEVDLDLKRADAWIGVANAAAMDALDTTNGAASETTPANINGGAAVAEGKVIYLEFATAYTEANHQVIFEMWFYEVGN